ncbi:MAG: FGGY family carbohydrate kinase [Acidimicrobiales bacterium]
MAHAIGIDVGSTNAKAALVADDGSLVARAGRPITTRSAGEVAEQDPEELWSAVVGAVAELTAAAPNAAADVTTVATCSQYSSIVPVNRAGRPTADLVMYFDTRGTDHSLEIMNRHPEAFMTWIEHHGIPPVGSGLSLGHMLHLQHDRPDVHAATATWLEPMDFVNLRLTGRAVATQCTMFTGQLCDNRTLGATAYDPELVAMAGIDADRLPELIPVDGIVGTVEAGVAEQMGIPSGAVVPAGMNDSHAGAFATGAFAEGRVGLAIGTTAVLLDTTDTMAVDLDHEVLSMPSPMPGHYLVWAENGVAGKSVEHVLGQLLHAADELGDHRAADPFVALDAVLAATAPGAGGVLFLPWLAGSMAPQADRMVRGGFLNLSLDTRRTDLVRAAVEGTAHNLAWLLPCVEAFSGRRAGEIVFGGGAARSHGWAQVLADVLDRPVHTLAHPDHAVARAVALVGFVRTGSLALGDLDALVETTTTHEPDSSLRARYATMQTQFGAAFEALRPVFHALNE